MTDAKAVVAKLLAEHLGRNENEIAALLQSPPSAEMGDVAFPCFLLAKERKQAPQQIAATLAAELKPNRSVQRISAAGPYLNFFINRAAAGKAILSAILKEKEKYGRHTGKKQRIMVEFFDANTHKAVHIGHIRNISLAEALCRIMESTGNTVVRVNYQGDIGPHVAKCLWAFQHTKEKPPLQNRGVWLGQRYAEGNEAMKKNAQAIDESKKILEGIYAGEKNVTALWKKTRQWCLDDFTLLYRDFDVRYNHFFFESEMEMPARTIAKELLNRGIAKRDDDAIIIDLKKQGLGIFIIFTRDGRALYSSKDLALARYKFSHYKPDRSIHVVGKEQELHFKQVFASLAMMGMHEAAEKSFHLMYGLVMLPEGKMSSREGNVVLYEELKQELLTMATKEVHARHPEWNKTKTASVAKDIAFAALKFAMINRDNNRVIVFDRKRALDFEGETGPYLLYAHARICSVFRKRGKSTLPKKIDYTKLATPEEQELLKLLETFPATVQNAAEHLRPATLARHLLDLAQAFTTFYHACPILTADTAIRDARLVLTAATRQVMENGLQLLAIRTPGEM